MSDLSKLISRLENGAPLPAELYAKTGRAHIVGITGPPGVGKSSLIDRLIEEYRRRQKKKVGVIAIDPTSPITGGALLGDRLRMQRHSEDGGVFIRSLATRNHQGGVTDSTPAIVHALDADGFDIVIVETVGTGQDEVEVADVADTVVVVLMPELGDAIQRAKSGLMEIADILVINKSDLVGQASSLSTAWKGKLEACPTSAKTGDGVAALAAAIGAHRDSLVKFGELAKRRARAARAEVIRLLHARGTATIMRALEQPAAEVVLAKVAAREMDPYDASEHLSAKIFGDAKRSSHGSTRSRRQTRSRG
jgi:LAO/AO transport system kinase